MITFQADRSNCFTAGLATIICKIVGTQCEKVTFSPAISFSSICGSYLPG